MIAAILNFLITAAVIYYAGKAMRKVHVKSFNTALLVTLGVVVFNFLVGWLLTLLLNLATLGIFYFTGLNFIISIFVNAIIIELVDKMSKSFNTDGFAPSLWLAVILALVNAIMFAVFRI